MLWGFNASDQETSLSGRVAPHLPPRRDVYRLMENSRVPHFSRFLRESLP
jgi:hypothetical protein